MFDRRRATRRAFMQALAFGGIGLTSRTGAQVPAAVPQARFNGIRPASPWPPYNLSLDTEPQTPSYLLDPPAVIPIDVGRQLFVDDFLVEDTSLARRWHEAEYYEGNPILRPERSYEQHDPYAALTGTPASTAAIPFSDGVFFDPADRLFKMWYMAGYQQHTALVLSVDGRRWERPSFDVVGGTNIVSPRQRDSSTVWLDLDTTDEQSRYKMASYDLQSRRLWLSVSPDGIHWREVTGGGPCGDRSTFFRDPFRGMWVFSLRDERANGLHRFRRYYETSDFMNARWERGEPVLGTQGDRLDPPRRDLQIPTELYNLDAVAYESVLLGLFTMYRGERPGREKPNDICLGFSRDGFHWSRGDRQPFIPVSERANDWNWGNVQSAGGGCLIVGDRLHFYVSGRSGIPGTSAPGVCSTGLATLRRDGFASLTDTIDARTPRRVGGAPGTVTTRPVRFAGSHLFVNAAARGSLRVEVLDREGRPIEPFSAARAVPIRGDGTRTLVQWKGSPSLRSLSGEVVRFRFTLSDTHLFSFWVSGSARGESAGYVAAGGPGFARSADT